MSIRYFAVSFIITNLSNGMRKTLLLFFLLVPVASFAQDADTIRVCTYNLLQFGTSENARERMDEFRRILDVIQPDVLLVQEIASREAWTLFQDSVLRQLAKPLVNPCDNCSLQGGDSYPVPFWDTTQFDRLNGLRVTGQPRPMSGVLLGHRNSGDSVWFITMHWKAGDTPEDEVLRDSSGQRLAAASSAVTGDRVLVGGDLNVYSSEEPGYQHLLSFLSDPLQRPGRWHNNAAFADLHSQSSRARQFGGGVHGGMDDRFDQILMSHIMMERYVAGSYTTFGNDGRHFNDSINALPNLAVSAELAQALHDASDHIPVYLDLVLRQKTVGVHADELWRKPVFNLW